MRGLEIPDIASHLGVLLVGLALAAPATAQDFEGRSRIELRAGAAFSGGSTRASVGNIVSEVQGVGGLGAIAFSHWARTRVALVFSIGGWAVDVDSRVGGGVVSSRTAVVAPLMGGVRYYLSGDRAGLRPYASFAAGPVFGIESESSVGTTVVNRSITRTAVGARPGLGFDVPFAGSWIFGISGGYTLMSDFSESIGSDTNHSAPDVALSISWTWGGAG